MFLKNIKSKTLFFFLVGIVFGFFVYILASTCTADYCNINPGEEIIIDVFDEARRVINDSGAPNTFIPIKTSLEWQRFRENHPSHITLLEIGVTEPEVLTYSASSIGSSSATLRGDLVDMGGANSVDVYFQWGATTSFGNNTPLVNRTSTGIFSRSISGLNSSTVYYFRAIALNEAGSSHGITRSFTTDAESPPSDPDPPPPQCVKYNAYYACDCGGTLKSGLSSCGVSCSFFDGTTACYGEGLCFNGYRSRYVCQCQNGSKVGYSACGVSCSFFDGTTACWEVNGGLCAYDDPWTGGFSCESNYTLCNNWTGGYSCTDNYECCEWQ